ncbi:NUDIX hydrolase [Salegentibacter chungangensis]|uniref:NUDIX hydrolase n=1 Tax=Salegentibacter chungangensis TaxID=1335724 RepID=A0ABW3NRK2_9FLAO
MDFQEFKNRIPNIKNLALPGEQAHQKLAPLIRIRELEDMDIDSKKPNKAGVMAVFYPGKEFKTNLVLILRKSYQGVHSNQIGFPGGRVEDFDKNLKYTALRETEEEIGVPRNEIKVIKKLTRLYIPPSNFWVQPYMGLLENTPIMVPQESEVEKIIEVDLDQFMDQKSLVQQKLSTTYAKNIEVPAFLLEGHIVWGATGMMLNEIREMLGKIL